MPIYAYKCTACGHAEDVLQKMSDNRLTECPTCKKSTYEKQVTAAGFQLKGSGWYVTDFRNNAGGTSKASEAAVGKTAAEAPSGNDSGSSESTSGNGSRSEAGSGGGSTDGSVSGSSGSDASSSSASSSSPAPASSNPSSSNASAGSSANTAQSAPKSANP